MYISRIGGSDPLSAASSVEFLPLRPSEAAVEVLVAAGGFARAPSALSAFKLTFASDCDTRA
jgi:hypothetical protein